MNWVLDCSLALAWALPDETSKRAERFLAGLGQETLLWVPALWWYELANALTMAHRRAGLPNPKPCSWLNCAARFRFRPMHTSTPTPCGDSKPWLRNIPFQPMTPHTLSWLSARELDWRRSTSASPVPPVSLVSKSRTYKFIWTASVSFLHLDG